ncbi:MAG: TrkA C-terminal domain-containing protein [Acidaminococcaceae bacterium]|nr:TrkA C-terminal domain-containing protein [Acidaminococcaceae bacterium]
MSSGIRNNWHCLILGIERGYYIERNPDVATILQKDDILWVLGKQKMINQLVINDVI